VRDLAKRSLSVSPTESFTVSGTVISGTDGDDFMYLRRSGENVLVWLNSDPSLPPSQVVPMDPFGSLLVSLLAGDDTLILDLENGVPLPEDSIIDGGDGHDAVRIFDTSALSGALDISDASLSIDSTDLEQIGVEQVRVSVPRASSLGIGGTARAVIDRSGGAFRTASLAIAAGAQLDIGEHDLIIDATPETRDAVAAAIAGHVKAAREGDPPWSGNGLTSSAALDDAVRSVAAMLNPGLESFAGQTVDANAVLVRLTYNGDANLDGLINIDDYVQIDSGYLAQPASPTYAQGNFNYDDRIDIDDYVLIDSAYLGQATTAAVGSIVATAAAEPVDHTDGRKRAKPVRGGDADLFQTRRRVVAARRNR
jgi:hypothetical protein